MIRDALRSLVLSVDSLTTRAQLATGFERPGLVSVIAHHVFLDRSEIERYVVDPRERLTVQEYRFIIEYFLEAGYRFVTPARLETEGRPDERLVMLTLDDGYWDNLRLVPVLEEYGVPVSIFPASGHVRTGEAFWWDVLYRGGARNGGGPGPAPPEVHRRLLWADKEATDAYLVEQFGARALRPVSDLDRPLTRAELRELSGHPLVFIGSHTVTHARLPSLDPDAARFELAQSRVDLVEMTGRPIDVISYPYAAYSAEVVELALACGYRYGISGLPSKLSLPVTPGSWRALQLGRFRIGTDQGDIEPQCHLVRSDVSLLGKVRGRRWFKG